MPNSQPGADFLINYNSFFFTGEAGVNVQIGHPLYLFGIKKKVQIGASADLSLWDPPMAGKATVSVWFVDFSVHFRRNSKSSPPPWAAGVLGDVESEGSGKRESCASCDWRERRVREGRRGECRWHG
jgi:hypothetical protein